MRKPLTRADEIEADDISPERMRDSNALGLAATARFRAKGPDPNAITETQGSVQESPVLLGLLGDHVRALSLVSTAITGKDWLVVQVPGGQIRDAGDAVSCTDAARSFAKAEGGTFCVFRPVVMLQPQTTVTEQAL